MPDNPGVGCVTLTVNDQMQVTPSVDPIIPDVNNNISFMLASSGTKQWSFNPNNPITIANPTDFSETLVSATQLNVTDTEADKAQNPSHNYTIHVQSNSGESFDFDPRIQDR